MTHRQLLGVLVRFGGLVMISFAFDDLYYIVLKTLHLPSQSTLPLSYDIRGIFVWGVFGCAVTLGAKWIVRFAYWRDDI